jgi:hypothetical protein
MKLSTLFLTATLIGLFPLQFSHAAEIKIPLPKFKPAPEVVRVENVIIMEPVLDPDEAPVTIEKVKENVLGTKESDFSSKDIVEKEETIPAIALSDQARRDIECLTEAIYFESVGEPVAGQIAVANVIMNRANWNENEREPHERHRVEFKGGVCDVIAFKISRTYSKPVVQKKKKKWVQKTYTTCAFSYRCERGFYTKLQRVKQKERWNEIKALAKETYIRYNSGENVDPSRGATFYHADYVAPWWRKTYEKTTKIGAHIFYKIR